MSGTLQSRPQLSVMGDNPALSSLCIMEQDGKLPSYGHVLHCAADTQCVIHCTEALCSITLTYALRR